MVSGDLFTPDPSATGEAKPLEIEGEGAGEFTPSPLGPDGKPREVYDCSMMRRFPGQERNMMRELSDHFKRAEAGDERKRNKSGTGYRSARQMAEDIDAEAKGEEQETKEEEI